MKRTEIFEELKNYISHEYLYDHDIGLDESMSLIEWGIIDSLGLIRLVPFIEQRFHVDVPSAEIRSENFENLNSITDLVLKLLNGFTRDES